MEEPDQFEGTRAEPVDGRDPRSSMLLRCDVIDALGRSLSCYLRNISRLGISARGCTGLRAGQTLTLVLPVIGSVGGTVRWTDGDRFGVVLETEIDPAMLRSAATPVYPARPRFQLLPQHEHLTDFRRPGFRTAG